MKYIIVSDIHGSGWAAAQITEIMKAEKPDFLLLLGDILYHGPRNPLPGGHDPLKVAAVLNIYKNNIIAVRGNCDAEVDQLLLDFPCMADYAVLADGQYSFFLTHGHLFPGLKPPFSLKPGSVFLSGHTHIKMLKEDKDLIYCNPGSTSLPKGCDSIPSYAQYQNGLLSLRRLDNSAILSELQL
ncbi:MAG: phosphodiesterase [Spirochaetaceae bacterium]|jgi:putative phosphoesterase|nr:phosphodiesterase [Spirochaetaceae bacterium]